MRPPVLRTWLLVSTIATALAAAAQAQQAGGIEGFTTLFISPCGEPFRGRADEPYPVVFWFNQTDANHDGAIDLAEFRTDARGFFDVLDRDHNGYLDGTEIHLYETKMIPDALHIERFGEIAGLIFVQTGPSGPVGTAKEPSRPRTRPLQGAAPYNLLTESEPVTAADADLNGRITLVEFLAAADRRFQRLDVNADGRLTLGELPKTQAQIVMEAQAKRRR